MTVVATSVSEVEAAVRDTPPGVSLLPIGGGSKPALSRIRRRDVEALDVSGLRGVVEYDPAELTITAMAGTPVTEVTAVLAEHGQYLPFDPPLAQSGATLGGAAACGASGPNACRHGGVRDFVIGVRLVDGTGTAVGGGGRVVKNAAGFDLPKLMVGSLGRLGVITQLSFKVFPRPRATTTLDFSLGSTAEALAAATEIARGPMDLDALDVIAGGRLLARLGGSPDALDARAARLARQVGSAALRISGAEEQALWQDAAELRWISGDCAAVRVALTARKAAALEAELASASIRYSLAGSVAWVAWPVASGFDELDSVLHRLGLRALVLIGTPEHPVLGGTSGGAFAGRVSSALDPHRRFLEI
jgi:glycolate oxidase FAD binding subunit